MKHKPSDNWHNKEHGELEMRLENFKKAERRADGVLVCPPKTLYGSNFDVPKWKRRA